MRFLFCLITTWWCMPASALVVLQYHHVSNDTPAITSVSPERFAKHMDYIAEAKFKVVSVLDVKRWLERGEQLPDRTVVITFDDGYRSVYSQAFPELKKRGWPFAVFINTQPHDDNHPQFASWKELREMHKAGATIANHTVSHTHLIRQPKGVSHAQWIKQRQQEVLAAEQRLQKEMGVSHKLFAYPFGEYDRDLQDFLKAQGFLAFGQQSGPVANDSDHQSLPRFPFGGAYGDMDDFSTKVASLPFPSARIKATDNDGSVLGQPELPASVTRPVLRIASPLLRHLDVPSCYASGQGKIHSEVKGDVLVARAEKALPSGRSRYNCTAHAGGGRFYWYSHLFIRRLPDGRWLPE